MSVNHAHPHVHTHAHDGVEAHTHVHDHSHSHSHDLRAVGRQALLVSLVLNAGFLVIEAGVGWWTSSLALLSDATHMLTDVMALVIAFVAATVLRRPRTAVASFGHARFAVLGGLANAVLSLAAAIFIVVEAAERLQQSPQIPGLPVLVTAIVGLIVNVASAWWLHRSGDDGVNVRGAMVHMLGDALGSVAAIIAGATLMAGGPVVVDAVVSVIVAVLVAVSAWPLLRDVVHILLERAPRALHIDDVLATVKGFVEVSEVVSQHIWSLDDGEAAATFVLATHSSDLHRLASVADELRTQLQRKHRIGHVLVEWRPADKRRSCCADDIHHDHDHVDDDHIHQLALDAAVAAAAAKQHSHDHDHEHDDDHHDHHDDGQPHVH
jgi:cobalt-zinc-cadmium efflux system protein